LVLRLLLLLLLLLLSLLALLAALARKLLLLARMLALMLLMTSLLNLLQLVWFHLLSTILMRLRGNAKAVKVAWLWLRYWARVVAVSMIPMLGSQRKPMMLTVLRALWLLLSMTLMRGVGAKVTASGSRRE
jgi:hypothetical protein